MAAVNFSRSFPFFAQAIAEWAPKSASEARWRRHFGGGNRARYSRDGAHSAAVARGCCSHHRRQNGGGHVLANFAYISRLGHGDDVQVPLYTSDADVLRDGKDMQVLAQDWQEWEVGGEDRRKGATSISMVLSMPAKTDPEALKASALDFAREEFANRGWVAALIWIAITRTFTLRLRAATKTAGAPSEPR
jgi:hypothetical protein